MQMSITSTSFIMHIMVNHYVTTDGTAYVYMHWHLYDTHTCYHALRINKNLTSTFSVIVIARHNLVTSLTEDTESTLIP